MGHSSQRVNILLSTVMCWKQEKCASLRIWLILTRSKMWWLDNKVRYSPIEGQLVDWWHTEGKNDWKWLQNVAYAHICFCESLSRLKEFSPMASQVKYLRLQNICGVSQQTSSEQLKRLRACFKTSSNIEWPHTARLHMPRDPKLVGRDVVYTLIWKQKLN